jgi:hypothetical protein
MAPDPRIPSCSATGSGHSQPELDGCGLFLGRRKRAENGRGCARIITDAKWQDIEKLSQLPNAEGTLAHCFRRLGRGRQLVLQLFELGVIAFEVEHRS